MYAGWSEPPQASFTIPHVTFLVNGQKHQCFNKVSSTRYEMCTESRSYTFFHEIFESNEGKPLDAVVSFPDVLYVFSGKVVYYVKKNSTKVDQNVKYIAVEKAKVDDPADSNMWTNIPIGHTAITMVNEKMAVVFTAHYRTTPPDPLAATIEQF
ncbi:hypothetical protein LOTGIDRAFT_165782 [Lottia gigantea]|uniref:Uncharacterized protein n=1 Tax=Lottia gigantea TaxID=225164 RepID=V4A532_LOTGI|nr:hypothetical protein LOTGIDRAFT_165782 [Lottia gigantea]ESO88341.1 hypothetical protein LOTGIDRAFT_165782 [Lottia gigantea]